MRNKFLTLDLFTLVNSECIAWEFVDFFSLSKFLIELVYISNSLLVNEIVILRRGSEMVQTVRTVSSEWSR